MCTKTQPAHGLADLPIEILHNICSFLDTRSGVQLSTTCRSLQIPAESRIWHTIRITHSDIVGNSFTLTSRSGQGEHEDEPLPEELQTLAKRHLGAWALSSQRLVRYLRRLLMKSGWRRGMIRSLNLELRHEIPVELVDLLSELEGLNDLKVRFPTTLPNLLEVHDMPGFIDCRTWFKNLEDRKGAGGLKRIKIGISTEWHLTVISLLRAAPKLEVLHIDNQLLSTRVFQPPPAGLEDEDLPHLPHLKQLIIAETHPSFCPTLTTMAQSAPHLEAVALRDQALLWRPDADEPLLHALAGMASLKTLELTSNAFDALCMLDGWEEVEELAMMWGTMALKDGNLIPPLPKLKRYQLEVSVYADRMSTQAFGHLTHPHLGALSHLLINAAQQLHNAPELGIIHCPTYLEPAPRRDCDRGSRIIIPDHRDPRFQGMIVYSYTNAGGEELLHCRTRVHRHTEDNEDEEHNTRTGNTWWADDRDEIGWEEHGWYGHKPVPVRVLAGVYGIEGMRVDDQAPGRNLALGEKGWEVLRTWAREEDSWS